MQIIPKANTLRKSVLLYWGIRYRKGYGVHSPFVFNLITKVIEERCSYYSFYDIELIRKQLLFRDDSITYPDRQQKRKAPPPYDRGDCGTRGNQAQARSLAFPPDELISSRKTSFSWGRRWGLSTLYLTSYAPGLRCIALENIRSSRPSPGSPSRMRHITRSTCARETIKRAASPRTRRHGESRFCIF